MLKDRDLPEGFNDLEAEFEILGELGRGGMAVVYLARDRELGRKVALKVIRAQYVEDAEALARFTREARTVAQLQHPNIVAVHAIRRLRGNGLALVMQYVPGLTLKELLRQEGPLPFDRIKQVLADICQALRYAHERGIVHRDVKPENIFLDDGSGRALLSDFGIARSADSNTQITLTGSALGTPAYMSPEQIDGGTVDGRSDLYSLGAVGWEMLTGRQPWEGESLYSIIYKQKHESLPPLPEFRGDVPVDLQLTIEGALEKDPRKRWPDADQFLVELTENTPRAHLRRWRVYLQRHRVLLTRFLEAHAAPAAGDSTEAKTIRFRRDPDVAQPQQEPAPAPARRKAPPKWVVTAAAAVLLLLIGGGIFASLLPPSGVSLVDPVPAEDEVDAARVYAWTPDESQSAPLRAEPVYAEEPAPESEADTGAAAAEGAWPGREPAEPMSEPASAGSQNGHTATEERSADQVQESAATPRSGSEIQVRRGTEATQATEPRAAPTATASSARPAEMPAPRTSSRAAARRAVSIVGGGLHSCMLTDEGEVWCWGGNDRGQVGDGSTTRRSTPTRITGSQRFNALATGISHSCGLTRNGEIYCWGGNEMGQLGDGTQVASATPVRLTGTARFAEVGAGMSHTCAITRSGGVLCWGGNQHGQLGDGTSQARTAPTALRGGGGFRMLAAGWHHTCALDRSGSAHCWGQNGHGQLGDGSTADSSSPVAVSGGHRFGLLTAGSAHTCGLTPRGEAFCWGQNGHGQLGDGRSAASASPVRVESPTSFVQITAGSVHTCALTAAGVAYCWGRNTYGQLGDGSTATRTVPQRVAAETRFTDIHASGAHTCATATSGQSYCWGYNVQGQLGDGTTAHRTRPVTVPLAGE